MGRNDEIYETGLKLTQTMCHTSPIYRCNVCNHISTTTSNLKSHKASKHEINVCWYECALCGYKTKRSSDLNRHTISVHGHAIEKILYCAVCDFSSTSETELIKHNMSNH